MLADHLGDGDYAMTRVVFVVLLVAAIGALVASIVRGRGRNRVLGLAVTAVLAIVAFRMLGRWDEVTEAMDQLTGPAGGEVRLSELDRVMTAVFGDVATFTLLALVLALAVGMLHDRKANNSPPSNLVNGG